MAKEIDQKLIFEILEKLPEEIKEVLFSGETADSIYNICKKEGVPNQKIAPVAKYVGHVLIGALSAGDFQKTLEKDVGLEKAVAERINQQINKNFFLLVGESIAEEKAAEIEEAAPAPKKPPTKDIYREQVEQ